MILVLTVAIWFLQVLVLMLEQQNLLVEQVVT